MSNKSEFPTFVSYVAPARTESQTPADYRLVRRGSEYVLQGCFVWHQGAMFGHEWRDLPTVIEEPHQPVSDSDTAQFAASIGKALGKGGV